MGLAGRRSNCAAQALAYLVDRFNQTAFVMEKNEISVYLKQR